MSGTEAVNSIRYEKRQEEPSYTVRDGIGDLFHGIGSIFHAASRGCDAICEAAPPPFFAYIDATRANFNGWGCGWGFYYPPVMSFCPPVIFDAAPAAVQTVTTSSVPQYTVSTTPQYTGGYSYSYTPAVDNGPFFPITGGPSSLNALSFGAPNFSVPQSSSVKDTANFIDRIIHPENFNVDGTKKNSSETKPEDKPIDLMDKTGKLSTPDWYKSIIAEEEAQKEKKGTLSAGKKRMKNNFANIYRKNGVNMLDSKTLDIKVDAQGNPVRSNLYNELKQLRNLLTGGNETGAKAYLAKCDDDKLAAIEIHYEREFGVPLRKAIKDCAIPWGLGWTNTNWEWAEKMMDRLDKVAMKSPENMVAALVQATENHNWCGFGLDDKRIVKLLKMMLPNDKDSADEKDYKKAFKKAFLGEFDFDHIDKKWFNKDEVMNCFNKLMSDE